MRMPTRRCAKILACMLASLVLGAKVGGVSGTEGWAGSTCGLAAATRGSRKMGGRGWVDVDGLARRSCYLQVMSGVRGGGGEGEEGVVAGGDKGQGEAGGGVEAGSNKGASECGGGVEWELKVPGEDAPAAVERGALTVDHTDKDRCKAGARVLVTPRAALDPAMWEFAGRIGTLVSPDDVAEGRWKAKFEATSKDEEEKEGSFECGGGGEGCCQLQYSVGGAQDLCAQSDALTNANRDVARAKRLLQEALKAEPRNVAALSRLGSLAHNREHNVRLAEEIAVKALEIQPNHADTLCNYGGILLDDLRKDYAGAERYFKAALRVDPQHVNTLSYYGLLVQEVHRDYKKAHALYDLAHMLDPLHANTLSNYGTFLGKVRIPGPLSPFQSPNSQAWKSQRRA